jgi:hypothetical protein
MPRTESAKGDPTSQTEEAMMKRSAFRFAAATMFLCSACAASDQTPPSTPQVGAPTPGTTAVQPSVGGVQNSPGASAGAAGATGVGMMKPPDGTPVAGAAGAPANNMMPPMTTTPALVTVDPADIAACNPAGAAPDASETVEVLKIRTSDAVAGGFPAPGGTYYGCFWVELDMPEKHHIIGWEGAVGDRAVHHQQVSLAQKPVYLAQQGGLCGLPTVDFTWTGEKPTEWTPKLAGYPLGGPDNGGKARFLWQVHFESPTMYTGGFNVYVTKNLRKYDAGNFEQGDVSGINIPPMSSAMHVATCTPDMTKQKLTYPIYVFAAMQHAHLTVTHIKSDMSRDGMEMKVFGDQSTTGFAGFFDQQFNPVAPCLEVRPGDQLQTTCNYTNNGMTAITGGEALNQEMCTTFFQYFPRLPAAGNNFCGTIESSGGFTPGK